MKKPTIGSVGMRLRMRIILSLVLPLSVAITKGITSSPHIRTRNLVQSSELCIDIGDNVGKVTIDVSDKHRWFCNHEGASCYSCYSNAASRVPSWDRGLVRMCRQINKELCQITAPAALSRWLRGIGFRDGRCTNKVRKEVRFIDIDLVGSVADPRDVRDFDCICPCDCRGPDAISTDDITYKRTSYKPEGYSCLVEQDLDGIGECEKGLVCYSPSSSTNGRGTCTRLVPFAKRNQMCLLDLGPNACVTGYVCLSTDSRRFVRDIRVGSIRTGVCTNDRVRSGDLDLDGPVGWYPDWEIHKCVMSCDRTFGGFCGGVAERWEENLLYDTAQACCDGKLGW
eukprot:CAMPEP_0183710990 /NCGR_PEP_ID=MMETSP0737-20130205/6595_1 /TAXON_ID=385413 /ORGANISM="Thalassiosira miniscula, Strain CCMP1093" /LENGTH=339 /DNA_ID=CAMNT_0025939381 /DNA_START=75 /DNA_END=1091 /DNA_ORIENTATION=-